MPPQEERAQFEAAGGGPPPHKDSGGGEPWRDPNYGRGWENRDDWHGPPDSYAAPPPKEGEWAGGEPWKAPSGAPPAEPVWEEDGWIWDEREQVRYDDFDVFDVLKPILICSTENFV